MYLLVRRLSRRYGTGRVADDLRWRVERRDVWPGIGTAVLALVATAIVVNVARSVLGLPAEATDQFGSLDDTTATRIMIARRRRHRGAAVRGAAVPRGGAARAARLGQGGRDPRELGRSSGSPTSTPSSASTRTCCSSCRPRPPAACSPGWRRRAGRLGPSMVAHAGLQPAIGRHRSVHRQPDPSAWRRPHATRPSSRSVRRGGGGRRRRRRRCGARPRASRPPGGPRR